MEAGGLLEVRPDFFGCRRGGIDLSNATRFYLTKPHARPRREFALPNPLFDNKAESPDIHEFRMKN